MEQLLIHLIEVTDENGILDLEHWKLNNTKENILKDDLLPMYCFEQTMKWEYRCSMHSKSGKWDLEYIHSMGIYYDYIIQDLLEIQLKMKFLKRHN